jgi:hypothetical protein
LTDPPKRRSGKLGEIIEADWFDNVLALPNAQLASLYLMVSHLSEASLPLSERSKQRSGEQD